MHVERTNLSLSVLYKSIRAETMEMGAAARYWHKGHVLGSICLGAPLCLTADGSVA